MEALRTINLLRPTPTLRSNHPLPVVNLLLSRLSPILRLQIILLLTRWGLPPLQAVKDILPLVAFLIINGICLFLNSLRLSLQSTNCDSSSHSRSSKRSNILWLLNNPHNSRNILSLRLRFALDTTVPTMRQCPRFLLLNIRLLRAILKV